MVKNNKIQIIAITLILIANLALAETGKKNDDDLIFHFDFKDAAGKREITDKTGKFKCFSDGHDFVVQKGALRLAPCAKIRIPAENLPDITKELTASVWILKKCTPDVTPILMKGEHPEPIEFLFSVGWRCPVFCYKNVRNQRGWKGIYYLGTFGSSIRYPDKSWIVDGKNLIESSGYWKNVVAVFNRGNIKIYVNGILTVEKKSEKEELLLKDDNPIYVGAERLVKEDLNYITADMLLNDLRLYAKSLSDTEVKGIFDREKVKYPLGCLIPKGENHLNALSPCDAYPHDPEYDPKFEKKLNLTKKYEKNMPKVPLTGRNITSSVKTENGAVDLVVDGKVVYPVALKPSLMDFSNGKYWIDRVEDCVTDFGAAGVDLVGLVMFPGYFWTAEGQYDWGKVDALFKSFIKANPRAKILVYFMVIPPPWFSRKYPQELEKCYYGANLRKVIAGPLGSEKWFEMSMRMLKDSVTHIEESDYAGHVYAYLPGGGQSAEWYWPGGVYGGTTGYSKATQKSFRKWLRKRYHDDDELLRRAWSDPKVTFDTAVVASPERRAAKDRFLFVDPVKSGQVVDFRKYMTDYTIMHKIGSAKTIKKACGNRKIVNIYTGYCLPSTQHKFFNSGLQDTWKIFATPYIDCLTTPITYTTRRGGQTGSNLNPFNGTGLLHGKLIWQENDFRTHFCNKIESGRTATMAETLSVIERGFGLSLTRNAGFWWLLFNPAWFHHDKIMGKVADLKRLATTSLKENRKSVAEVAFIFDENSLYYLSYGAGPIFRDHAWGAYQNAERMGAPYDFYLLEDIGDPRMPDYKLYIFLNTFFTDETIRRSIAGKVRKNNAVSVWCYAPGFITEQGLDVWTMYELTGIKLKEIREERKVTLRINDKNCLITKSCPRDFVPYEMGPLFSADDPKAKVLGIAGDVQALAVKELTDWRSVFSLTPLTKELLLGLCDYAGVHVYSRSFDVFTANKSYMMLHTSTKGDKTILLPGKCNIKEILTDKIIVENSNRFTEKLPAQTTRIYQLLNPE